ncbi:uncharacterized protein LOC142774701 [Rhipicephalus microplus]|uniref:uncharacterized protein LOC142774701 n=1 Tax=Rhipicephalus microplus TaxID=6941 RepID=UPI003F6A69E6
MNLDCYPADGTAGMSPPPRDMSPPAAPCHADVAGGSGDEDPLAYQTDPGRTGADEPRAKKRRKQSNPVRYHTSPVLLHEGPDDLAVIAATDPVGTATDDEECAEDVPPSATSPAARSDDTVVDAGVLNLETSKRRRRDDFNGEPPEMASGPLRCHHCNAGFATDDQLRLHIEEEHVQKLLEKQLQQQASYNRAFAAAAAAAAAAAGDKNSGSTSSLDMQNPPPFLDRKPTVSETAEFAKNHPFPFPAMPPLIPISQSGNEVKPGSLPVPLGMFPNPMAPFLFPVLQQQGQSASTPIPNGSSAPSGNMRIFNPEAFCELCNKEFCNKYFLKTHKANKHGIYSVESLVSSPYAPGFFPPGLSGAPSMQLMLQGPMSDPSMAGRQGIINMESFCEICQKEFCNKYFLKKHKQKIHGIVDPATQQQQQQQLQQPHQQQQQPQQSSSADNSAERKMSTSPTGVTSTDPVGATSGPINDKNGCSMPPEQQQQQQQHQQQQSPSDPFRMDFSSLYPGVNGRFSMPSLTPPTGTMVTSASSNSPIVSSSVGGDPKSLPAFFNQNSSSSTESGSTTVFTPEKLREMGVINAEAFCEICCKEFCNKYFLRTHKQNKHGIPATDAPKGNPPLGPPLHQHSMSHHLMPPAVSMAPPTGAAASMSTPQDTPENLTTPSRTAGGGTSPESAVLKSTFASEFEPTADLTCEICNRPFSSQYLLKMHKFYTHNVPYVKEEDEESKPPSPIGGGSNIQSRALVPMPRNDAMRLDRQPEASGGGASCHTEDAASQDLQKLQSMIRDLTASIANENKVVCNVCRTEFDNKYFLRAHMMNEHGVLLNEDGSSLAPGSSSPASASATQQQRGPGDLPPPPFSAVAFPSPVFDSEAFCEICQKEFCSKYFLKTHKQNIHGINMDCDVSSAVKKDDAGQAKNAASKVSGPLVPVPPPPLLSMAMSSVPTTDKARSSVTGRNYCNICNKELCNKYFMKTHMLKMHGINLDEHPAEAARNSVIGGVTCEICQKELCSKYFLKVHKQNTHGIIEDPAKENSNHSSAGGSSADRGELPTSFQPGEVSDGGSRSFNHYTEVCPLCDRRFKSIKWLKTHMVNDHSDMLKENVYSRMDSVPPGAAKLCIICGQGFPDKVALQIHLIKDHRTTSEELGLMNSSPASAASESLAAVAQDTVKLNGAAPPHPADRAAHLFKRPGLASTLGGSGSTRIYHCSYCVYSTRWLSNLYAHEKRHTGVNLEGEKRFVCRICHRAYRYNHSLQRHLLNHRAAGLASASLASAAASVRLPKTSQEQPQDLSSADPARASSAPLPASQQPSKLKRYRCSKCNRKFRSRELCLNHIYTAHDAKRPIKSGRPFRCRVCGFATRAWNILKIHIMKQHQEEAAEEKGVGSQPDVPVPAAASATDDEGKPTRTPTPTKTAGQLPMTYAMPQSPPSAGTFIMQPFLIAQPESEDAKNDTFVPSLVYLPVCQKVSQPMTVAFTLTPA